MDTRLGGKIPCQYCGKMIRYSGECGCKLNVDFSDVKKVFDKLVKIEEKKQKANSFKRDPKRIPKILKQLEKIWKKNPDLRLGQLLTTIKKEENGITDIYYWEDVKLIEELEKFYK